MQAGSGRGRMGHCASKRFTLPWQNSALCWKEYFKYLPKNIYIFYIQIVDFFPAEKCLCFERGKHPSKTVLRTTSGDFDGVIVETMDKKNYRREILCRFNFCFVSWIFPQMVISSEKIAKNLRFPQRIASRGWTRRDGKLASRRFTLPWQDSTLCWMEIFQVSTWKHLYILNLNHILYPC